MNNKNKNSKKNNTKSKVVNRNKQTIKSGV